MASDACVMNRGITFADQNVNVKKERHKAGRPTRGLGASDAKRNQSGPPTFYSGVAAPKAFGAGADDGIRTRDLRFTKPLLYQLSYVGATPAKMALAAGCGKREEYLFSA